MWLHGFNISPSNIIDNSACNLYHVQKCKILCFVLFMDVQSKKCWSAFYFIESIQSISMMWCDANQFFSSKDTETSYQQFLPLSCQQNIDNSSDIVYGPYRLIILTTLTTWTTWIQCSPMQPSTAQYSPEQPSTAQYSPLEPSTAHNSTLQQSTAHYNQVHLITAQYSTVQHSTHSYIPVQPNRVQYSSAQSITAQYSPVQPSTV